MDKVVSRESRAEIVAELDMLYALLPADPNMLGTLRRVPGSVHYIPPPARTGRSVDEGPSLYELQGALGAYRLAARVAEDKKRR
jgi:hypothetical protein